MFLLRLSILAVAGLVGGCGAYTSVKDPEYPFTYGAGGEVVAINVDGQGYPVRRRDEIPPPKKITDELIVYEVDYDGSLIYCATYLRCRNEILRRQGRPVG